MPNTWAELWNVSKEKYLKFRFLAHRSYFRQFLRGFLSLWEREREAAVFCRWEEIKINPSPKDTHEIPPQQDMGLCRTDGGMHQLFCMERSTVLPSQVPSVQGPLQVLRSAFCLHWQILMVVNWDQILQRTKSFKTDVCHLKQDLWARCSPLASPSALLTSPVQPHFSHCSAVSASQLSGGKGGGRLQGGSNLIFSNLSYPPPLPKMLIMRNNGAMREEMQRLQSPTASTGSLLHFCAEKKEAHFSASQKEMWPGCMDTCESWRGMRMNGGAGVWMGIVWG